MNKRVLVKRPAQRQVLIYKDGNVLRVRGVRGLVQEILHDALHYTRKRYLATFAARQAAGRAVELHDVLCYDDIEVDGEPQLVTNAGYLPRIANRLQRAGYRVLVKDVNPFPRPERLATGWQALEGFDIRRMQQMALEKMARCERGQVWWATGVGKSFLILLFCKLYHRARIVVTTKSVTVLEDRYAEMKSHIPSLGIYHGGKKYRTGARVLVCSAGCLHHVNPAMVDILLADEHHELATDRMFRVFAAYHDSRMYGLSANYADRFDGADFELEGVFGPVITQVSYQDGVDENLIVPIEVHWRDVILLDNPCLDAEGTSREGVSKLRAGIWRNRERNKLIATDARSYPDEQVLIVVQTLEHACFIKKHLPEFELCYRPGEDNEEQINRWATDRRKLLPVDEPLMTPIRMATLKTQFEQGLLRKAIATSVWNRGVNFRHLQVLIRADATSSATNDTQIPGRLSRLSDGKSCGILIDYLDQFDDGFKRKAGLRKTQYKKKGWLQVMPDTPGGLHRQQLASG